METVDTALKTIKGALADAFSFCFRDRTLPFFLAGGLNPGNVGEGVVQVCPGGVDVSSGVETDGAKDMDKVDAFVAAVHAADAKR